MSEFALKQVFLGAEPYILITIPLGEIAENMDEVGSLEAQDQFPLDFAMGGGMDVDMAKEILSSIAETLSEDMLEAE